MADETTMDGSDPVDGVHTNGRTPTRGRRPPGPNSGKRRRKKHRNITKDLSLQKKVVLATFFKDGMPSYVSANEVARTLGLAVPAVVAILAEAFRNGLFKCVLNLPYDELELATLADRVKTQYGLRDVVVVPGDDAMLHPKSAKHRQSIHQETIGAIVARAASYLGELLTTAGRAARDGKKVARRIGVAWGYTMSRLVAHLRNSPRLATTGLDLEVVPIIGATGLSYTAGVEASTVAADMARIIGGQASHLPCCAFVEEFEAKHVKRQPQVKAMLEKINDSDIVITGMGQSLTDPPADSANGDGKPSRPSLANDEMMSKELYRLAVKARARAEVCAWFLNEDGEEVHTKYEALGLGIPGLRKTAADPNKRVVLLVGGDPGRVEPLKIVLKARLVSVLITDSVTSKLLLGES